MSKHATIETSDDPTTESSDEDLVDAGIVEAGIEYLEALGRELCKSDDRVEWGQPTSEGHATAVANVGRQYLRDGIRSTAPRPAAAPTQSYAPTTSPQARTSTSTTTARTSASSRKT